MDVNAKVLFLADIFNLPQNSKKGVKSYRTIIFYGYEKI